MDRLDYLRRDSFYTGVVEGRVGVDRILKTLRVFPVEGGPDAEVVIEAKGIYAVENFLISRRLMYWQVYLHKTVLAGDQLLRSILRRARYHLRMGDPKEALAGASPVLRFFLDHAIDGTAIDAPEVRDAYCRLDDSDVLYSLKRWTHSPDAVLADLAHRFINRNFFRTTFLPTPPTDEQITDWRARISGWLVEEGLSAPAQAERDADYYLALDHSRHSAYERVEDSICVLRRDGSIQELSELADTSAIEALTSFVVKPYLCAPKEVILDVMGISDD